ncbi:MAG: beta strand repeat-containing protein, partial [Ruegeria sp.]
MNGGSIGGSVIGDSGDDTITLDGTAITGDILGGNGVDTIDLISGSVRNVNWGAGDESGILDLTNVTVSGDLEFGTGVDNFTLNAGTVGGNVRLGRFGVGTVEANTFIMNGGQIQGSVVGDNGDDIITLSGGTIGGSVLGNLGVDTITLDGTAITGDINAGGDDDTINLINGSVRDVNWGAGNESDILDLTNVTVSRDLIFERGDDNFTLTVGDVGRNVYLGTTNAASTDTDTFVMLGGTIGGSVIGDNGVDTITLDGTAITGDIRAFGGDDTINLINGSVRDVNWGVGDESDILDLTNVTLGRDLIFERGDDNFTLRAGAVGRNVYLGLTNASSTDTDTFVMTGGTIGGSVIGDNGVDTITLDGTAITFDIRAFAGVDTINLISGSVRNVDWGNGDESDILDLTNVTVSGELIFGGGADNFTLTTGDVAGDIHLGFSNGTSTDTDTFVMNGGSAARIIGDNGIDNITLNGGVLGSDIIAFAGVDTINLISGSVRTVNWGNGDESGILDLTNVTVSGELIFGGGADNFTLTTGEVAGDIHLGFSNGTSTDTDTFVMNGGSAARIIGDNGIDNITLNGGDIGTDIIAFAGDDTIDLISGSVRTVNWGAGDESGTLDLTNVTLSGSLIFERGNDDFTLEAGTVGDRVFLGTTNAASTDTDIFTMNGGVITVRIEGDNGDDTVNLNGGQILDSTSFRGFGGNDTINLNGATLSGLISAGDGDDTFNWTDGTLTSQFVGGRGNDTATISAATYAGDVIIDGTNFNDFVNNNGTPLDPSDDFVVTDTFVDTLTFDGANTGVNANTIRGWESVSAVNSTLDFDSLILNGVSATGNNNVATALNVTGGDVTLSGASILADLLGSASNEALTVTGTTVVSNAIEGGGGADTISVLGDASVTNGVFGGADGHDASTAADAGDTITINTTGTVALVDGGLGDDNINLIAGSVPGSVLGQEGDDTVTIFDGFSVTSLIDGGTNTAVGDTFAVDTATTRTFDGTQVVNFESLQKDNTGTLILTGDQTFSVGTAINGGTLDVDGTLGTAMIAMADDTSLIVDG